MQVKCFAQAGKYDTILLPAYVVKGDTFSYQWLDRQFVKAVAPAWLVAQRRRAKSGYNAEYETLKRNVRKVYPYAVMAAYVYHDIDSALSKMYSKEAKSLYKERRETALNNRFKSELKDLTIDQGKILIKLINRQSGKSVYEIVKTLKGGFQVAIWQGVAYLFSHNLKSTYDPTGVDVTIEEIVREIERSGTYVIERI